MYDISVDILSSGEVDGEYGLLKNNNGFDFVPYSNKLWAHFQSTQLVLINEIKLLQL